MGGCGHQLGGLGASHGGGGNPVCYDSSSLTMPPYNNSNCSGRLRFAAFAWLLITFTSCRSLRVSRALSYTFAPQNPPHISALDAHNHSHAPSSSVPRGHLGTASGRPSNMTKRRKMPPPCDRTPPMPRSSLKLQDVCFCRHTEYAAATADCFQYSALIRTRTLDSP